MESTLQLIAGDGAFNAEGLRSFVRESGMDNAERNYTCVAIMGPQSSGKSTLLNHVFGTRFVMMDAMAGRRQTTVGVWLAKSERVEERLTWVMDLEGSDSRERGKDDDTKFERQSALFALAVADILLINIWCHDIGREHAAGKPLLKTVFQVNMKLFKPEPEKRRTVLLFVLRDRSRTPHERLVETLMDDMQSLWQGMTKPAAYENSSINDFFELAFVSLPNFEEREEDFRADSVVLRRRFTPEGDGCLLREEGGRVPGSGVERLFQRVWEVIESEKDLDLPAEKVMVATVRCSEIVQDQLAALQADALWLELDAEASQQLLESFGARCSCLISSCLSGYDKDALYFDASVRDEKRALLAQKVRDLVAPLHERQARFLRQELLDSFAKDLEAVDDATLLASALRLRSAAVQQYDAACSSKLSVEGAELDAGEAGFTQLLDDHIAACVQRKVDAVLAHVDNLLKKELTIPLLDLLDSMPADLWARIRALLARILASSTQSMKADLAGCQLSAAAWKSTVASLEKAVGNKLRSALQEAANTVLPRMSTVFDQVFTMDEQGLPRTWVPRDNIEQYSSTARTAAARVLSQLAVVQLRLPPSVRSELPREELEAVDAEEAAIRSVADQVEAAITRMAATSIRMGGSLAPASSQLSPAEAAAVVAAAAEDAGADDRSGDGGEWDVRMLSSWPGVAPELTLIEPSRARKMWRDFGLQSQTVVRQAVMTQQANRNASNKALPVWAIAALVFFGFDEVMGLLYSPGYMLLGGLLVLFLWSLYQELDVDNEMKKGMLPGLLSIWTNLAPACRAVVTRTIDAAMKVSEPPATASAGTGGGGAAVEQRAAAGAPAVGEVEMAELQSSPAGPSGGNARSISAEGLRARHAANASAAAEQ